MRQTFSQLSHKMALMWWCPSAPYKLRWRIYSVHHAFFGMTLLCWFSLNTSLIPFLMLLMASPQTSPPNFQASVADRRILEWHCPFFFIFSVIYPLHMVKILVWNPLLKFIIRYPTHTCTTHFKWCWSFNVISSVGCVQTHGGGVSFPSCIRY